jgi:hypothetical protein
LLGVVMVAAGGNVDARPGRILDLGMQVIDPPAGQAGDSPKAPWG